jgi:anti-anti-sigma factor
VTSKYQFFDVEFQGDAAVVRPVDTRFFDTDQYRELLAELSQFGGETRARPVVVDLDRVTYCSTAVVNGLIQLQEHLGARGGKLKLANLSSETKHTLRFLRLDQKVFETYETKEAAFAE